MAKYYVALAHERFQPDDLLKQAGEADVAGFDGVCCSDHLSPWWTDTTAPTSSGNAWVWLGAAARETKRCDLGSAVTGIVHPVQPGRRRAADRDARDPRTGPDVPRGRFQ